MGIVDDYHNYRKFAWKTMPITLLTVMGGMGASDLSKWLLQNYAPGLSGILLGVFELVIATIGLWLLYRREKT